MKNSSSMHWRALFGTALLALVGAVLPVASAQESGSEAGAAAPEPAEKSKWERSAGVGLTVTEGNSDTLLFTADAVGIRKWDSNELSLGADATYGEQDGDKSAESIHGYAQYNRLFSDRLFGYGRLDALHDSIADVDYRITLGPGIGYYFLKSERTSLSGEFGPSFIYEKQGDDETGYLALRLAERFEHELNDRARIWQSLEFLPQVDDFENFIVNAELGVEADLTAKLALRTFIQDTYDNQPAPGREENDVKLVSSLNYKF